MAEFNRCAQLVSPEQLLEKENQYLDLLVKHQEDPFQRMLDVQNSLQEQLAHKLGKPVPPKKLKTKGELVDFLMDQKIAFDDEFRELIEAVHGMSRPESERSACWKKWKSKHDDIRSEGIYDNMTQEDIIEAKFECIDAAHFFLNILLAMGINSKDLYSYYMIKNEENFNRSNRGY